MTPANEREEDYTSYGDSDEDSDEDSSDFELNFQEHKSGDNSFNISSNKKSPSLANISLMKSPISQA